MDVKHPYEQQQQQPQQRQRQPFRRIPRPPSKPPKGYSTLDPNMRCAVWTAHCVLGSVYVVPLATMAVIYPIAIESGRVWEGDFFVSSALDEGVGHGIGAVGFGVAIEALMLCAMVRFLIVRVLLRRADVTVEVQTDVKLAKDALSWAHTINAIAIVLALVSNVCLFGACAFNVGDPRVENKNGYFGIHIPFALTGFLSMSIYIIFQTLIDELILIARGNSTGDYMHVIRWFVSATSLFCFIGMFATLTHSLPISASFEIALVVLVLIYYASWHAQFNEHVAMIWWRLCIAFPDHQEYVPLQG